MKNIILPAAFWLLMVSVSAQVTYETNNPIANPVPLGFLGWDDEDNTILDIRQNGYIRMRFIDMPWTGLNGLGLPGTSRVHMPLYGTTQLPFSMLHMGSWLDTDLQRPWMNVGITLGAADDIVHLGIIERPISSTPSKRTDAVLAWGCNDDDFEPGQGPDNLRFLFISPTGGSGDAATEQGRECVRITPPLPRDCIAWHQFLSNEQFQ